MNDQSICDETRAGRDGREQRQRRDEAASAAVEHGLSMQARVNTVCAIEYLKSRNVDPEVITRVLGFPERRRKTVH